jgi:CHAT domain-containing protein
VLSLDWSKYRYIHLATHAVVDAEVPQLSAIVLGSYDSKGEIADRSVRVSDLALESLNADVVAFSACDTALGRQIPSEGLMGLGTTTLARGAHAVLASLWPVADEMGAQVMTEFYRHLLHDSASAPAALGAAMRSAVTHDRVADPALWAAFQVSVATLGGGRPIRSVRVVPVATPTRS